MVIKLKKFYTPGRFPVITKCIHREKRTPAFKKLTVCSICQQVNNNSFAGPSNKHSQIQSFKESCFEATKPWGQSISHGKHFQNSAPGVNTIMEIHKKHGSSKAFRSMLKNNSSLPRQTKDVESVSHPTAVVAWSDGEDDHTYTLESLVIGKSGQHGNLSDDSDSVSGNLIQPSSIGSDGTGQPVDNTTWLEKQNQPNDSKPDSGTKHLRLHSNVVGRDHTGTIINEIYLDQTLLKEDYINSIESVRDGGKKSDQLDETWSSLANGMPYVDLNAHLKDSIFGPEHASRVYSLEQMCEIKSQMATYLAMPSIPCQPAGTYAQPDAEEVSLEIADPKISSPTIDGDFSEENRCFPTIGGSVESSGQSSKYYGNTCSKCRPNQHVVSKILQSEDRESTTRTIPKHKKLRRKVKITLHESPVSGEQEPSSLLVRLCIDPVSDTEAIHDTVHSMETNKQEIKHDVIDKSDTVKIYSDALHHQNMSTWVSDSQILPVNRQPVSFQFNEREKLKGMAECLITSLSSLSLPVSEVESVASSLSWSWSEQRLVHHRQHRPISRHAPPNTVLVDLQTDDDEEVVKENDVGKPEGDYNTWLSQVRSDGATEACILKIGSQATDSDLLRSLASELRQKVEKGHLRQRQRSVTYHLTQEPVIDKPSMDMLDSDIATFMVLQPDQFADQHFPVTGKEAVLGFSPSLRITFGCERKDEDQRDDHFSRRRTYTMHQTCLQQTVSGDKQFASSEEATVSRSPRICAGQCKSMACQTHQWNEIDEVRMCKIDASVGTTPVQVDSKLIQCLADSSKPCETQSLPYLSEKKAINTAVMCSSRQNTQWFAKRIKPEQTSRHGEAPTHFFSERRTRKNAPSIRSGEATLSEVEHIRDTVGKILIKPPTKPRVRTTLSGQPIKSQLGSVACKLDENEANRNSIITTTQSKLGSSAKKENCNARSRRTLMSIAATEKSSSEEKSASAQQTRFKFRCFRMGLPKAEPMSTENVNTGTSRTSSPTSPFIDESEFTPDGQETSQLHSPDLHGIPSTPACSHLTGERKRPQYPNYYYYHYYYYEQDKQHAELAWPELSFTSLRQQRFSNERCSPESADRVSMLPVSTDSTLTYDTNGSIENTSHWRVRPPYCISRHQGPAINPNILTPIQISLVKTVNLAFHQLLYSENTVLLHLWPTPSCYTYINHTHYQKFTPAPTFNITTTTACCCRCCPSTEFCDDILLISRLESPTVNLYQLGSMRIEESTIWSTQLLVHSSCYLTHLAGLVSCLMEERRRECSPLALSVNQLVRGDKPGLVDSEEFESRWVTHKGVKQCWGALITSWQSSEVTVCSDMQAPESERCTQTICPLTAGTITFVSKEKAHGCVGVHNCYVYQLQPLQKHKCGLPQNNRLPRLQCIGRWMRSILQVGGRRKKKESPTTIDTHKVTVRQAIDRCSKVRRCTEIYTSMMDRHVTGVLSRAGRPQRAHIWIVSEEAARMKTVLVNAPVIRKPRNAYFRSASRVSAYSGRYAFTVGKSGDQRNMPLVSQQRLRHMGISSTKVFHLSSNQTRIHRRRKKAQNGEPDSVWSEHNNQIHETRDVIGHVEVLVQQQSPSLYLHTYESKLAPCQRRDLVVPQCTTLKRELQVQKIDPCKLESSTMHGFGDVSEGDQHNLLTTMSNCPVSTFDSRVPSPQSVDMETSIEFSVSTSTEVTSDTGQTMTPSKASNVGSTTSSYHRTSTYGSQTDESTLTRNPNNYTTTDTSVCWGPEEVVRVNAPRLGQRMSSGAQTEITITDKSRRKNKTDTKPQNLLTRSNSYSVTESRDHEEPHYKRNRQSPGHPIINAEGMHQKSLPRVQQITKNGTRTTTTVELGELTFNQPRELRTQALRIDVNRTQTRKANHVALVDLDITNTGDRRSSSYVRSGFTHKTLMQSDSRQSATRLSIKK